MERRELEELEPREGRCGEDGAGELEVDAMGCEAVRTRRENSLLSMVARGKGGVRGRVEGGGRGVLLSRRTRDGEGKAMERCTRSMLAGEGVEWCAEMEGEVLCLTGAGCRLLLGRCPRRDSSDAPRRSSLYALLIFRVPPIAVVLRVPDDLEVWEGGGTEGRWKWR